MSFIRCMFAKKLRKHMLELAKNLRRHEKDPWKCSWKNNKSSIFASDEGFVSLPWKCESEQFIYLSWTFSWIPFMYRINPLELVWKSFHFVSRFLYIFHIHSKFFRFSSCVWILNLWSDCVVKFKSKQFLFIFPSYIIFSSYYIAMVPWCAFQIINEASSFRFRRNI